MGEEWSARFLRNRFWILRHGRSIPNERGLIVSSLENGVLTEFGLAPEGVTQAQLAGEQFLKLLHWDDEIQTQAYRFKNVSMLSERAPTSLRRRKPKDNFDRKTAKYVELEANNILLEDVRICYSPFSRTSHTAKVVANVLGIPFVSPQCKVMEELRERFFGPALELLSHDKYAEIWALDETDPFKPPEGGESVADVVSRLAAALTVIETEFQGCAVLVVSHGDPLQMFQTIIDAVKEQMGSCCGGEGDLLFRIKGVTVPSILSRHRRFELLTGELRQII